MHVQKIKVKRSAGSNKLEWKRTDGHDRLQYFLPANVVDKRRCASSAAWSERTACILASRTGVTAAVTAITGRWLSIVATAATERSTGAVRALCQPSRRRDVGFKVLAARLAPTPRLLPGGRLEGNSRTGQRPSRRNA